MAGSSLLLLMDDIAAVLDDVATMTKVAAKKTAGVLGDDLALNAEQVTGVRADRELPVVWAVAKGSFRNKLILVPLALAISALAPWLVTPLLMCGGLYLCFEGCEKILHPLFHSKAEMESAHQAELKALADEHLDIVAFEKEKVSGAIRTDFILSAEIIVIALGTVANQPFVNQVIVVSLVAIAMTVGVYTFVAGIVKMDDVGLYLVQKGRGGFRIGLGKILLGMAPRLMKLLSVVGTLAMFLVGGGILVHGLPFAHHWVDLSVEGANQLPAVGRIVGALTPTLINMATGLVAGLLSLVVYLVGQKLFGKPSPGTS